MFLECNISYSCCTFLTFAFRYPYYLLNVIDREVAFITWLRYTAWIPLYPTGFVLEGKNLMENRRFLCVKSHTSICCCRTCFSDVHGIVLVLYECWKIFITDVYFTNVTFLLIVVGYFSFIADQLMIKTNHCSIHHLLFSSGCKIWISYHGK